jgi:DNA/RNA-binding domain of Phe-tRNA-synthetase-like protein
MLTIGIAPHEALEVDAFVTRLPGPVAEISRPSEITPGAPAPFVTGDSVRAAVRALLRVGGFKPSGRSKPAAEYLAAAVAEARFPSINAVVDACNVASLHSGLPISLVDVAKLEGTGPLAIAVAPIGTSYVFNPSGQVIDAGGLLCLFDGGGPTGTPVKDAQRTKTDDATRTTLSIIWGTRALAGRTTETARWYRALVETIPGAVTEDVELRPGS